MHEIESLIFLLAAAALLAQLARVLKVPYPILLVLGGLVMGFVPGLPNIEIPPEVIFVAFLPPLLNSAAFSSSPLDLRAQLRPIVLLAVGLVLATMGAVAVIAHALIGLPWAAAFVLGAILAPTDPVATEAIFGRLGVPERVGTVVSGESLVNDGTGLVAFRVAVAAVISGAFSVWEASLSFLLIGGGGMLVGLALARIVLPLWVRLRSSASFSRSSSWRSRWSLRAFTAPVVSFTLRRLLLLFGGESLRPPLGVVRVWRTESLPVSRSTSSHLKPNSSPCLRPVVMASA